MPLFAHWRHTPVFSGVKRGRGGGEKVEDAASTSKATKPSIFCHYNADIEDTLTKMHVLQRGGDKTIQSEIDRYLVACISPKQEHLILPRNSIPHYDNLPDVSAYAVGILDPTMDSEMGLQQVLLLLRQCIPLRRRTKRAQREVQWKEESCFAMHTLVRCMQGTLLGLYPNSLKVIAFGARIGFFRLLRSMIVLSFDKLHACMQRIPYIIKLCCMEHLCNTIYDYHPGICHTLNQSGQKVEHFCNSVSTICDIFRGELNTMYCAADTESGGTLEPSDMVLGLLNQLEKIAHSYFERCTRAYRGIIIGHVQQIKNSEHAKRLMVHASIPHIGFLLKTMYTACTQSVFELIHFGKIPKDLMDLAWHITQTVQVHQLPQCVAKRQLIALGNRYSGDTTCITKCRNIYICVQCAIKRGGAYGMRLRHDCRTGELMCIHCGPGTVLTIDMLGRMLIVASDIIVLSSCCGTFIYYSGSGFEFNSKCGLQCVHSRQLHKKKEKTPPPSALLLMEPKRSSKVSKRSLASSALLAEVQLMDMKNGSCSSGKNSNPCVICRQKNTQQSLHLLDLKKRAVIQHCLCVKHLVPNHIVKTVFDLDGLHRYFKQRNSSGAADDIFVGPAKRGRCPKQSKMSK
jgi:hypothetical protein